MFKMEPIIFTFDLNLDGDKGYYNDKGWVYKKQIVATPRYYNSFSGSELKFEIFEIFTIDGFVKQNNKKLVFDYIVKYKDFNNYEDFYYLLEVLASGDLRGKIAEDMVSSIFRRVFFYELREEIRPFLKEWVEFQEIIEKHTFEQY